MAPLVMSPSPGPLASSCARSALARCDIQPQSNPAVPARATVWNMSHLVCGCVIGHVRRCWKTPCCVASHMPCPALCLQPCVFKVDYVVEQLQGREFGSVFLNQTENVALTVAAAGWAKVRTLSGADANNPKKNSPYMEVRSRCCMRGWSCRADMHTSRSGSGMHPEWLGQTALRRRLPRPCVMCATHQPVGCAV